MQLSEDSEFIEIKPRDNAPVTQQPLAAIRETGLLPEDVLIAAIKRNSNVLTPKGDTVMAAGDLVTVLVNDEELDVVLSAFGHETNGD